MITVWHETNIFDEAIHLTLIYNIIGKMTRIIVTNHYIILSVFLAHGEIMVLNQSLKENANVFASPPSMSMCFTCVDLYTTQLGNNLPAAIPENITLVQPLV